MRLPIFEDFDEQSLVCFTGKLNVLSLQDNKYVGDIIFHEGEIINAHYSVVDGFKALMKLCVLTSEPNIYKSIIEPELIDTKARKIDIPIGNLKRKITEAFDKYKESEKFRPPSKMKLLPKVDVISFEIDITPTEYSVLCTLSDYNLVDDVYNNNELLDYEITQALVTLRKKEIIKVVKLV